jgi:hypothetical protein
MSINLKISVGSKIRDGSDTFTITYYEHGMTVSGPNGIPLHAFDGLAKLAKGANNSWTQVNAFLSTALGCTFVFCSSKSGKKWREEINERARQNPDRISGWIESANQGASSQYLLSLLSDSPAIPQSFRYPAYPTDWDAFILCKDMLEWTMLRNQLHTVKDPEWEPWIRSWDRLLDGNRSTYPMLLEKAKAKVGNSPENT